MSLNGVREETKTRGLDWSTVGSSGACVVQSRLKRLARNIKPSNAPHRCGGAEEEKEEEGERWEIESHWQVVREKGRSESEEFECGALPLSFAFALLSFLLYSFCVSVFFLFFLLLKLSFPSCF